MIHIMVSFSDYQNSIFVDRVPYKYKNWQHHGILQISVQMSTFSPHMKRAPKKTCSILFYENGPK